MGIGVFAMVVLFAGVDVTFGVVFDVVLVVRIVHGVPLVGWGGAAVSLTLS